MKKVISDGLVPLVVCSSDNESRLSVAEQIEDSRKRSRHSIGERLPPAKRPCLTSICGQSNVVMPSTSPAAVVCLNLF